MVFAKRKGRGSPLGFLVAIALIAMAALGATLQVYAMPVEARTTEPWYSYETRVAFDFTARVKQGEFYASDTVSPDQLIRTKQPVDPATYRRVLISRLVDDIQVRIPYQFTADRPAAMQATMRIEGIIVLPGVWHKPYPVAETKQFKVTGTEVKGTETFVIPIRKILADMDANRASIGTTIEPMEIHLRPVLDVQVAGLRQPVQVTNQGEFVVVVRSGTVEVDDKGEVKAAKTLAETRVVPITIPIFGSEFTVAALRQASLVALVLSLGAAAILIWTKRRTPDAAILLRKLGPSLIRAQSFELPTGTAIADVRSVQQLLQLHAQTDRPVILVGHSGYLLDGTTCYRLRLKEPALESRGEPAVADASPADPFTVAISADNFTLDPWMTDVQLHTELALLDLHKRTGKSIIRTDKGYHLLDGGVCFTYRPPVETSAVPLADAATAKQDD